MKRNFFACCMPIQATMVLMTICCLSFFALAGSNPNLVEGTWINITPSGSLSATGVYHIGVAPSDPSIVYLASDKAGMWKTTNSGFTWVRLGNPNGVNTADLNEYLDDPCQIIVDPKNPDHVIATEGVDGGRDGFWISHNGGNSWTMPKGFRDVGAIVGGAFFDVVMMSADPADFNHIIVSTHSDWNITAGYSSGFYETKDCGVTWTYHLPPNDQWAAGTKGIHILHNPATGLGNGDTWLICDENSGFWRTSDAGKNWTRVSTEAGPHGGNESYYGADGKLYIGSKNNILYSTDNGITWTAVPGLPGSTYQAICGTGTTIFAQGTSFDCAAAISFYTSSESNGRSWTASTIPGAPKASSWEMKFDAVNRILYSANRCGGFWALKFSAASTVASALLQARNCSTAGSKRVVGALGSHPAVSFCMTNSKAQKGLYNVKGERLGVKAPIVKAR